MDALFADTTVQDRTECETVDLCEAKTDRLTLAEQVDRQRTFEAHLDAMFPTSNDS